MARSFVLRAIWFLLVGWWLTFVAINVAWFLNVTVLGLPLGIKILDHVPTLLTLKEPDRRLDPSGGRSQRSLLVRAVYFVLVGWWLSLLWTGLAWALAASIVGLPVAVVLFDYLPYVTSLYRFDG